MIHSCSERKMMIWSLCLIISLYYSILGFSSPDTHLCRPDQRDALWELRSEFYVYGTHFHGLYKYETTELWTNNTDCCSWDGISCDPKTGKVVELNLWGSSLNGPLRSNSSMFRLQDLQNLNLDENNFHGILPHSIGNLKNLRFLSIRSCGLYGKIPSSLGNLSYLTNLDLSDNDLTGELPDSMGSLHQLLEFQLGWNKISGNFPLMLLNLSELTTVYLYGNKFKGMLPSNMSSLSKLLYFDITSNSFFGSIPSSLFMMPSLISLYLGINDFSGPLEIGNISSSSKLENLSLNNNNFKGEIPRSISKLVGLQFLDLSFWNARKDMVDFSIFLHLKSLEKLYLSYLNTRSMIDLSFFTHLILLSELDLSGNNLNISATLHFPAPIQHLDLSSCNIAEFPKFIQNQTSLTYLHISENQIEGQVPEWLWKLPGLVEVNISQNFISGFEGSADVIQGSGLGSLDISSNAFLDLPLLPKNLVHLLGSDNRFSGEIPNTICELFSLDTLILSSNNFSGSIPRCFQNFNYTLSILHLQNNSLSGVIPEESISTDLISLDLGHNWLSGALPKSLMNCTQLEFLNVEDNKISDKFPFWMRLFTNLQILVLRSNEFHGPISSLRYSLSFPKLRIFDISDNCFSGVLPSDYFAGWSAFSSVVDVEDSFFYGGATGTGYYHQSVDLTNKGLEMVLVGSGFKLYKTIDVSANKFEGDIPESIGLLKELIVLNMSDNSFTGRIPPSLGNLTNLQSLDLSRNGLSGEIPSELGKLTFLEWMNFSHNRLEGPIPQSTQIQSQNSSSFAENPGLCGVPLTKTCGEATKKEEDKENEEKDQVLSWIAAAIGCVPGLFCGFTIGHFLTSYKRDWLMKIFNFFA